MIEEARLCAQEQPELSSFFHSHVLQHGSLAYAISFGIATHLSSSYVSSMVISELAQDILLSAPSIIDAIAHDIQAYYARDAACVQYISPLLYFKGFHALICYRLAHWLWCNDQPMMALYVQHRVAETKDVDIHPGAAIGSGIFIDHATGLVIGETSVIEDDVSILHGVTLGGSGCSAELGHSHRPRHPYIESGVMISVGAKLLGGIRIGRNTKIGAGSLVLKSMPAQSTVVGVPAVVVGSSSGKPSSNMQSY